MPADQLQALIELRENVAALKAVKCRLHHEEIPFDPATNLPAPLPLAEQGFHRVGFCPPELRRERLACGHTMSRYVLRDALDMLEEMGGDPQKLELLRREVETVGARIYDLDIGKGMAERRAAELAMERRDQGEPEHTEHQRHEVRAIEAEHDACVMRIAELRDDVLRHLDLAIAEAG